MILLICALIPWLAILLTPFLPPIRIFLAASAINALISVAVLTDWSIGTGLVFGQSYFLSDASSRVFLALIAVIFLGVSLYVFHRAISSPEVLKRMGSFVRSALLFYGFCVLAVLSNHLVFTWIALEASTLAAVPMVCHQKDLLSYRAGWKYLLFSSVGLGIAFLGLLCLAKGFSHLPNAAEPSFFLNELAERGFSPSQNIWIELGLVLALFGFGAKLGLAPMYTWLPETYDIAPPSVTALLAAVQYNCVILAVFRLFQSLHPLDSSVVRYELIAMGLGSILVATLGIVAEKNYKKMIAYASINHTGVIAVGLGLGKSAAYGVVLYVLSNALVKAILFLTCGNIKARYHTKKIEDLHGLIQGMPASGTFFMLGIFALLGFAPFGSFFGEIIIMAGMIELKQYGVFAFFCLLLTVIFVATGRATFPMIWGESPQERSLSGESIYTLVPNLFFVGLLIALGIYIPSAANSLLRAIANGIGGGS